MRYASLLLFIAMPGFESQAENPGSSGLQSMAVSEPPSLSAEQRRQWERAIPILEKAPLVRAAVCVPEQLRALLREPHASVDQRVHGGETPLSFASFFGTTDCVRILLGAGARTDVRTDGGETPLHYALQSGNAAIAFLLIEAGAPIIARDYDRGYSVLMIAAGLGRVWESRLLLLCGAPLSSTDLDGRTALMHAIRGGHFLLARSLFMQGDLEVEDQNGETALYYAVRSGDMATVRSLLRSGAQPDHRNSFGETPLMLATSLGNESMVRWLLAHGANSRLKDHLGTYDAAAIGRAYGHTHLLPLLESPWSRRLNRLIYRFY
jgi:ankyrin repeat protein